MYMNQRIKQVGAKLTAKERALVVLHAREEETAENLLVRATMPPDQVQVERRAADGSIDDETIVVQLHWGTGREMER